MGRFMLYNGDVRPSDSYLATHVLPGYEPDDWYNDDYDVEDDEEILYMPRTCKECLCTFTLYEAMSDYADRIDWPPYTEDNIGEYCGNCAADRTEEQFNS